MLAHADATGDQRVFIAVKRAVDCTMDGYAACRKINFTLHDVMYADVLESLFVRTGDRKYLDFGLRLYHECPDLEKFLRQPEIGNKFQRCYNDGHGATVTEVIRMLFWFGSATGDQEYLRIGLRAVSAMSRWIMPSGALVSEECVSASPNPWNVGYEYCAMFEREFTLIKAGATVGDALHFDAAEHLWLNAAQGSREPDGSAVLYCSHENRLSIHDEMGKRQRFSPTHAQIAVCCNPNAARIASYFIANAWMKPGGAEPALAAALYAPCEMKTEIAGTPVRIEEATSYPYSGEVKITLTPAKPAAF